MARMRRLKVKGEEAFYHVMSRTVGQEFYLGDIEKEKLFNIIKYFSGMYFVKVIGFVVMSNHFHLLFKSEPGEKYTDEEVLERARKYIFKKKKGKDTEDQFLGSACSLEKIRSKLQDISRYVGDIKQTFSRWYNKTHSRTGYFWGDRFKSVLVEEGKSLLETFAYIDLNPVRAGMVQKPEDYRWNSFSYWLFGKNKDHLLCCDGMETFLELNTDEGLKDYHHYLYYRADITPDVSWMKDRKIEFKIPEKELLNKRIRYFSDGLVLGSKTFIKDAYLKFEGKVIHKKDRNAYVTGISPEIFSLRRIKSPT